MTEAPEELRKLNDEELVALQSALALASRMAVTETALSLEQVQALYDEALQAGPNDIDREIAIGLAFGALFVDGVEFEWARITDRWGSETCVAVVGKMLHAAPISMIQKRLRRAEPINLAELRDAIVSALRARAADSAQR
ncbi:MAG: DUF3806 domain-containing protein [Hyphomonadaceae bacterium]